MESVTHQLSCQSFLRPPTKFPVRGWEKKLTNGIIHPLIYTRPNPPLRPADHNYLRDLERREIAQPQPHKLALLVHLIALPQCLLKRHAPIRRMQVEDIHALCVQLLQALLEALAQLVGLMLARVARVAFRCEAEAAILPVGGGGEGFLLAADVDACGVLCTVSALSFTVRLRFWGVVDVVLTDFGVALALEVVEIFVVIVQ